MSNNAWAGLDKLPPVPTYLFRLGRGRASILATGRAGTTHRFLEIPPHGHTSSLERAGRSRRRLSAATIGFAIPAEISGPVRELARRSGATLFSTLLAAFQVTLSRWTGAEDIVVGTPVANRTKQDVRETMGYFSGVVPLREQVERNRPFAEHLRIVHQSTVDSFANAMPFAELVRAIGERPSPKHNPIFEVRFALQNHPVPDVEIRGLSLKLRMRSTGTPRFDLGCEITELGDALEVVWLFRENLFSQPEIEELGRLFRTVVENICRVPERRTAVLTN